MSGAPADINDVWWCQPTATNNYVYISYGDYTTSQLIDLGYTHLSVSVAILTHTTNSTHVLVNGVVDFTDDSGTSITLNKDTSGQWLNYTIDLSTLEDGALNNKATLLNSKKPTTPSTQDENDTYVYSSTYVQNLFVYAEIVKN